MVEGLTYSVEPPRERRITELGLKIDKRASVPIFVQIENAIKYLVATGHLAAGDRLPSVRMLAHELDINPNTVDKAYMNLEMDGFISIEKGKGTFVKNPPEHLHEDERMKQLDKLTVEFLKAVFKLGYSVDEIRKEIQSRLKSDL
jgi:GntR family transcriptional regulator